MVIWNFVICLFSLWIKSKGKSLVSIWILTDGIFYVKMFRSDLVPAYVRLLRDNEAEVRIAAAGKVTKFCRILSPELAIQHILPCVKVYMLVKCLGYLSAGLLLLGVVQFLCCCDITCKTYLSRLSAVGVVNRFIPACSFCIGFGYNGHGPSFRKGKYL